MHRVKSNVLGLLTAYRRWLFVGRTKLLAKVLGVDITLDIHPSVRFERGAVFKLTRGNPIKVTICEGVTIEENFHVQFYANVGYSPELYIGPFSVIHRNVSFTVSGRLWFEGEDEIGIGSVIRASQAIEMGKRSGSGEFATIYDFVHAMSSDTKIMFQDVLICRPVRIGSYVLVSAKATVQPGTSIPDIGVILPGAVISGIFTEPMRVYAGNPAKVLDRFDIVPMLENPFLKAFMTWGPDGPGPMHMPIDEALQGIPAPARYDPKVHAYPLQMERKEAEKAAAAAASAEAVPGD